MRGGEVDVGGGWEAKGRLYQWVNHLQNNIFVNPSPLLLLCEISSAYTIGSYSRLAGR